MGVASGEITGDTLAPSGEGAGAAAARGEATKGETLDKHPAAIGEPTGGTTSAA